MAKNVAHEADCLHSVSGRQSTLTILEKPRYGEHSVSICLLSYEFQNLEALQTLERTRLHIKGLKFQMSFSISVQMRLRHFSREKQMKLLVSSCFQDIWMIWVTRLLHGTHEAPRLKLSSIGSIWAAKDRNCVLRLSTIC